MDKCYLYCEEFDGIIKCHKSTITKILTEEVREKLHPLYLEKYNSYKQVKEEYETKIKALEEYLLIKEETEK